MRKTIYRLSEKVGDIVIIKCAGCKTFGGFYIYSEVSAIVVHASCAKPAHPSGRLETNKSILAKLVGHNGTGAISKVQAVAVM